MSKRDEEQVKKRAALIHVHRVWSKRNYGVEPNQITCHACGTDFGRFTMLASTGDPEAPGPFGLLCSSCLDTFELGLAIAGEKFSD